MNHSLAGSIRLALAGILVVGVTIAHAAEYVGSVNKIVDGDTFWLCDATVCNKIRLCGVNAPERSEPGYRQSGDALKALVWGKAVRCLQVGAGTPCDGRSKQTSGDRIVAQCFADGLDIAAALVGQGIACDWQKFSAGHYSQGGNGAKCPK